MPTGTEATASTPATSAATARGLRARGRLLLLRVRASNRGGGNRAADHSGDRDQRQHVRQGLEERSGRLAVGVRQPQGERAREAEQQRRAEGAERAPVSEDQRGERDEA